MGHQLAMDINTRGSSTALGVEVLFSWWKIVVLARIDSKKWMKFGIKQSTNIYNY